MIKASAWSAALLCLGLAGLSLAACKKPDAPGSAVSVTRNSYDNGKVVKNKIVLTAFAMRSALGNNPNTSAYVTIANEGNVPDRLLSAACTCADRVTLHTMTMSGGMMRMHEMNDGFAIAPGQVLTFVPGGDHIMLEGLKDPPRNGDRRDLILTFEKAGAVTLSVPVDDAPLSKSQ
ncbi:MAG TPA: copper chaperone PCu(A)C [Asticcacaulis sp.]|nr:copper chaperone PCu(A)C [Asticcacaulis sp.]